MENHMSDDTKWKNLWLIFTNFSLIDTKFSEQRWFNGKSHVRWYQMGRCGINGHQRHLYQNDGLHSELRSWNRRVHPKNPIYYSWSSKRLGTGSSHVFTNSVATINGVRGSIRKISVFTVLKHVPASLVHMSTFVVYDSMNQWQTRPVTKLQTV